MTLATARDTRAQAERATRGQVVLLMMALEVPLILDQVAHVMRVPQAPNIQVLVAQHTTARAALDTPAQVDLHTTGPVATRMMVPEVLVTRVPADLVTQVQAETAASAQMFADRQSSCGWLWTTCLLLYGVVIGTHSACELRR